MWLSQCQKGVQQSGYLERLLREPVLAGAKLAAGPKKRLHLFFLMEGRARELLCTSTHESTKQIKNREQRPKRKVQPGRRLSTLHDSSQTILGLPLPSFPASPASYPLHRVVCICPHAATCNPILHTLGGAQEEGLEIATTNKANPQSMDHLMQRVEGVGPDTCDSDEAFWRSLRPVCGCRGYIHCQDALLHLVLLSECRPWADGKDETATQASL